MSNKLVTVETIDSVKVHPNADKLDIVEILGFQCIVPRDKYKVNDRVIYIRPDSVLPDQEWAVDFKKYAKKRVRAIKIRQVYSEGIIVDPIVFPQINTELLGEEIADVLGVIKYEAPLVYESGKLGVLKSKGMLPYGIPKTDEERWESLKKYLPLGTNVDVSLKIDGTSSTYFYSVRDDRFGYCSRSLELYPEVENVWSRIAEKYNIKEKLVKFCKEKGVSLAIRGEIYGANIQSGKLNPHAKQELSFAMYSSYLIDTHEYAQKGHEFYYDSLGPMLDIPVVPMLERDQLLTIELIKSYSENFEKLPNGDYFEGVVMKHSQGSFKVISKLYDSEK